MITQRQLNSNKRSLNEKMKELKGFTEKSNVENTQNNTSTGTDKEVLMNQLRDYRKEVQEFKTALPENDETQVLINKYKDVYITERKLAATLQKKVNQLKEIRNTEQQEK